MDAPLVVTAGSGPVGLRAAGLLAKAGARVTVTSRRAADGSLAEKITQRFGGSIREVTMADSSGASQALEGAEMFLNAGPAGVCLIPRAAWVGRAGLQVAVDVNAVPPLGVEGIEVTDDGATREGVTTFGALGIGDLKMKIHKACIARLFEKNDLVLDAETIAELAETCNAEFRMQNADDVFCVCILHSASELHASSHRHRSGTVSLDICGLDAGRVFLDESIPTADALADPVADSRSARTRGSARSRRRARPATVFRSRTRAISVRRTFGWRVSRRAVRAVASEGSRR